MTRAGRTIGVICEALGQKGQIRPADVRIPSGILRKGERAVCLDIDRCQGCSGKEGIITGVYGTAPQDGFVPRGRFKPSE